MKQFVSIMCAVCFFALAMLVIGVYFGGHVLEEQLTGLLEEYDLVKKTEEETIITEDVIEETIIEEDIIEEQFVSEEYKEELEYNSRKNSWDCN